VFFASSAIKISNPGKPIYLYLIPKEHNRGKSKFTKGHRPWKLVYFEEAMDWKSARVREKYLKSAAGKMWLKKEGFISD